VNAQTSDKTTPLHWASAHKRQTISIALLAAGADRTLLTNTGRTARDFAATDAMRALLDA
jgi:ankyrin repeat protein